MGKNYPVTVVLEDAGTELVAHIRGAPNTQYQTQEYAIVADGSTFGSVGGGPITTGPDGTFDDHTGHPLSWYAGVYSEQMVGTPPQPVVTTKIRYALFPIRGNRARMNELLASATIDVPEGV